MKKINPAFKEKLIALISSMGYELYGYEWLPRGSQTLFRIYIDSDQGVTIDDCSKVSRQVSALLDVENPIDGRYTLEVSSPGVDRPLFELDHYREYIGQTIKVKLSIPIATQKQFKGMIKAVTDDKITLLLSDSKQEVVLPFTLIEKANLIGEIGFQNA